MYTGTLIDDLFEAVERAEKAAAQLRRASQEVEEAILVSTGASTDPYRKLSSETE
jgi:hypothetical protein